VSVAAPTLITATPPTSCSNLTSGTAAKIDAANLRNSADPWLTALNGTSSYNTSSVNTGITFSTSCEFQAVMKLSATGGFFCVAVVSATRNTIETMAKTFFMPTSPMRRIVPLEAFLKQCRGTTASGLPVDTPRSPGPLEGSALQLLLWPSVPP